MGKTTSSCHLEQFSAKYASDAHLQLTFKMVVIYHLESDLHTFLFFL